MRETHLRKCHRAIVALRRQPIDDRPAGVSQMQELADLVIRLPRRVISSTSEPFVRTGRCEAIEARMSARDDEHDRRHRHLSALEHEGLDVTGQVMNGNHGDASRPRQCLRELQADEQRSDEARPLRHGDRLERRRSGIGERALDHAADVADVLPRRQLGNDAAPLAMDGDLRGDDVRTDPPGAIGAGGFLDHRRRRLVAGGLDAEDDHDRWQGAVGRGQKVAVMASFLPPAATCHLPPAPCSPAPPAIRDTARGPRRAP